MEFQKWPFLTVWVVGWLMPGPRTYLSPREEGTLEHFLKHCAKLGYGKTRKDVLAIAESTGTDKGLLKSSRITERKQWINIFIAVWDIEHSWFVRKAITNIMQSPDSRTAKLLYNMYLKCSSWLLFIILVTCKPWCQLGVVYSCHWIKIIIIIIITIQRWWNLRPPKMVVLREEKRRKSDIVHLVVKCCLR